MLINKNRYQISKDRKLMHKVGKQWVVVSAFVLALLGAKGAKTMIHASSTESPDQQVTNQMNQRLQQNQKLVKQQNAPQSVSGQNNAQNSQSNDVQGATQSVSNTSHQNIMQAARDLHTRIMTHNLTQKPAETLGQKATDYQYADSVNNPSGKYVAKNNGSIKSADTNSQNRNNLVINHSQMNNNYHGNNLKLGVPLDGSQDASNHDQSIYNNQIKPGLLGGTSVQTGSYYGLNYTYNPNDNSVEFTSGTMEQNPVSIVNGYQMSNTWLVNAPFNVQNASTIKFDNGINTTNMTNMIGMFWNDPSIQHIDLGNSFNTSNVTDMQYMFGQDSNLQTINFGNSFNTSRVTNMGTMFVDDPKLQSLNLPNSFNTSNVNNMYGMFGMDSFRTLTLPDSFNTRNVTEMGNMFLSDVDLVSLTLPNTFNTQNVMDMSSMFQSDKNIGSLNLNTFNTQNVTNMSEMFYDDPKLTTLVLPANFGGNPNNNTTNIFMYNNEWYLKDNNDNFTNNQPIDTSNWTLNTSRPIQAGTYLVHMNLPADIIRYNDIYADVDGNSTPMENLTYYGNENQNYQLSANDLPNGMALVDNNGRIIPPSSQTINISNGRSYNINVVPVYEGLAYKYDRANNSVEFTNGTLQQNPVYFQNNTMYNDWSVQAPADIQNAKSITFDNNIDTTHVSNMTAMFMSMPNLQTLNLGNAFNTSNVTNMEDMFYGDNKLTSLTLPSSFDTHNVTNMSSIFNQDTNLNTLTLPANFGSNPNVNTSFSFYYNNWYQQDPNDHNYTTTFRLSTPNWSLNNASPIHAGTYVIGENLPTDTINYTYNHHVISTQQLSGYVYKAQFNINSGFNSCPSAYHLTNPNNLEIMDGQTHDVPVQPNQMTDTIDYTYNGKTVGSDHNLTGSDSAAKDAINPTFTINGGDEPNLPSGYHLMNANNTFNYDGQTHSVPVNISPDTIVYHDIYGGVDGLTNPNNETIQSGQNGLGFRGQTYHLNDNDVPAGWALVDNNGNVVSPDTDQFQFNGESHVVNVAPVHGGLTYKYNKNDKSIEFMSGHIKWNADHNAKNYNQAFDDYKGYYTSFMGKRDGLPSNNPINQATSVSFSPNINLDSGGENINDMFRSDDALKSIDLSNLDVSKIKFMGYLFQSDHNLTDIHLGEHFDTGQIHFVNMFADDTSLQHLTLPSSFDTRLSYYTAWGLTLLFENDNALNQLTIESPNTIFGSNVNNNPGLPGTWYQEVDHGKYTNGQPTTLNDGKSHVGVFVRTPSLPYDSVHYVYDNQSVATQEFKGDYDSQFDVDSSRATKIPDHYHLVQSDNYVLIDAKDHNVAITPDQVTDVVDYQVNGQTIASDQYTGNTVAAQGASNTSFTVTNGNLPTGYHLSNAGQTINYDGRRHVVNVLPNIGTASVHYVLSDGSSVPASDDNGGVGTITGHTNEDIDPIKQVAVPKGYHLANPNSEYHFSVVNSADPSANASDDVEVLGDQVKGTSTVHLIYKENDGTVDDVKDVQVPISGNVDDVETINPMSYARDNYTSPTSDWTLPITWRMAASGNQLNYPFPDHTFIYVGTKAVASVNYVDVGSGAQLEPNVKDTITGSDENKYDNQTVSYQGHNYPIIGHQTLNNIGIVGQTVNLTAKGANSGTKDMVAPAGFHFVDNDNNDRVLMHNVKLTPNLHLTVLLGAGQPKVLTQTPVRNLQTSAIDWSNLRDGTAHVNVDPSNDTITVSNGIISAISNRQDGQIGGLAHNLTTASGQPVPSDELPNNKRDWTLRFNNVRANRNSMYFMFDGKNETTGKKNFIGDQVATIKTNGLYANGITNMEGVFLNDYDLKDLDLTDDYGNSSTFARTSGDATNWLMSIGSDFDLQSLDASYLDTSSAENLADMFDDDTSLQSIKLGGKFQIKAPHANMDQMLASDYKLQRIDWNDFSTKHVTSMNYLLGNDRSLPSITLPDTFDTSDVTNMGGMFQSDVNAQKIDLSHANFDTHKVTDMHYMFGDDKKLQQLDFGNHFDTQNVTNMSLMFGYSDGMNELVLPSTFDTRKVTNMSNMFESDVPQNKLHKLLIQSPNTKFNNSVWGWGNHNLYRQFSNGRTLTTPNDFSKGTVGTFVTTPNPTYDNDWVAFTSASDNNAVEGTPFTINNAAGSHYTIQANDTRIPQGYQLTNDGSQSFALDKGTHLVHVKALNNDQTTNNSDVPIVGDLETVPVEFIDQNGNRISTNSVKLQGSMDTFVNLPTSAPHGYHLVSGQQTRYLISDSNINPNHPNQVYPVMMHVMANHVNVNIQYKLPNGTKVGNVVTIPNQQVGSTVDLTRDGLPKNEMLAPDHGDPKHYQLNVNDLTAPNYNQTKSIPVYVTPMIQSLTINYVDQAHDKFLDSRTAPSIDNGSKVYLANDNVLDRNSGSFITHDKALMGYQAASGQNLSPTVQMQADGDYPTYTVNMQSQPAILHVTYYDFENGRSVGSDEITQNDQGRPASIGDVISLPTVGHSNGLDKGYTLNSDQLTSYPLNGADKINNQHAVKNISMLAHGNSITAKAPVTVNVLDGDQIQRSYVINAPVYGHVGNNITFNSSDFQAYLPKNYVLASANNGYNHTDYTRQKYTADLMPSDMSNGWQANSWQIAHNGNYWDQQHQRPLIMIQVATGKQITVHFIDQNHDQVGATTLIGDYRNRVDLNDPSRDNKSALNGKLPNGYTYGDDNPATAVYGRNPRTVDLNVVGKPETVKTEYDDQSGRQLPGSTDDVVDNHRTGDLITLSTAHLPTGYHVTNPNVLTYRINPADDPQRIGTIIRHVAVAGNSEVLPVKFVDQNGTQVGDVNYQTKGVIGQNNVALPAVPAGYHYDTGKVNNGNTYDFTASQIDPGQTGSMKPHVVYLQGDAESVPINFVDQNGKLVSSVPESGQIGNVITLPNAPQNYSEDQGQPTQYRLNTNNINTPGHMKPATIHVWTNQKYQFNVTANENVNGTLIGKVTTPVDVSGPSGTNDTVKPSDHVPAGFRSAKVNQSITTTVTDSGLSKTGIIWQYNATNSRGNQNPNDHLTAQPIYVTYRDADTGHALKNYNNVRLDGYMGTHFDVTDTHNGGVAIPQGYALDPGQSTLYQVTTTPQHVTLNVHGATAGDNEFQLQIAKEYYRDSTDAAKGSLTTLTTPQSITENGDVDSQFKVDPNNYVPAGYHLDTKHGQSDQTVTGTVKVGGLDPGQHTFYYVASPVGHNNVNPINVTYYDDQTGDKEGTNVVTDGYMDQTYTVSQLGTNGLAKGYRVDPDQNQIYTVSTKPIEAHVMVHGDVADAKHNVVTVQIYQEDPYGNFLSNQPSTVQDVINGSTGKRYTVSAEDYVPSGYQMDTRKNGDHNLTGVINPDGSVSKNDVKFYYQMSSQAEDNLKPIHVMYENDADRDVIANEVITPSEAHDDYNGKFVDVIPTKSNSNPDNQQTPVPQGYTVDSQQDTRAGFSNVQPTYIDVLVHNDSHAQYHDRFDQIENFYDGDQLVRASDVPQTVNGVDGQSFTINAPQTPVGYTAARNNSNKVTGYINGHQLTTDNANYRFNATNSTGYDHPSDYNHAQPILVTFKDGAATVGKSDQRVDGYMDQTVNVLTRLALPSGYRTVGGDQLNYWITNHVQKPVVQIVPETAQNAIVNYEDQDSNHVIAQRAVTVPVGTKLTSLSDEYTTFMPYGYAYAGHNNWNNQTQVTNNGQYVVYVTKLDDRARPLSKDASDNGRIDVDYQDRSGRLISAYTLNQVNGTAFKASDYTKARSQNGQMPNNFTNPQIVSGGKITKFNHEPQILTIKVNASQPLATARVEYEDAKTHQLITDGTQKPLSITISGHAGDTLNYDAYQRFVPQGYTYYGMGDYDNVIENGDVDIVMVRKAKLNNNYVGQINVTYRDTSTGSDVDTVSVNGLIGRSFNLNYYEHDLPLGGYDFAGANQNALSFNHDPQNVTINLSKPQPIKVQHYGKIKIHFVRADASVIKPGVNGNQDTNDNVLKAVEVPNSVNEVMTGHIGDLFNPEMYEHNTPQGTTFDHIVKGNDISAITKDPQNVWIAVQAMNGQF